jgi:hypothetical protein
MTKNRTQTSRKPATKFANLRKKMQRQKLAGAQVRKPKRKKK